MNTPVLSATATTKPTTNAPIPACPVCAEPVGTTDRCTRCRWTLSAGPWVGLADSEHLRRFGDDLSDARRLFDLGAAVAAALGDPAVLNRMLPLVRGGRPGDAEVADALRVWAPVEAELVTDVVSPVLARFAAATDDPARTLTLLELTPEGVHRAQLRTDAVGTPSLASPPRTTTWAELLPTLPADVDECRFVLAHAPEALRGLDQKRLTLEPQGKAHWVVVLNRLRGWRAVDTTTAMFRSVHPVRGPGFAEVLDELLAGAPLRLDHSLVLVAVDRDGSTKAVRHPLFRPGSVAEETEEVEVELEAPADCGQPVLAVVAGPRWAPARECAPVVVSRCPLPPGRPVTLRFRLRAPGAVHVVGSRTMPDPHTADTWPALLDELPAVHHRRPDSLDLAIAVERGGVEDEFTRRRDLAVDLLEHLAAQHQNRDSVRVAVIAYADHEGLGRAAVVSGCRLEPLAHAMRELDGLHETVVVEPKAAPVEDALRAAASLAWAARHRHLVLIGGRPPHPSHYANIRQCPNGFRIEDELRSLGRLPVRRLVVWDEPDWCRTNNRETQRTAAAWRSLGGAPGYTPLADADAGALVRHMLLTGQEPPQAELLFPIAPAGTDLENPR